MLPNISDCIFTNVGSFAKFTKLKSRENQCLCDISLLLQMLLDRSSLDCESKEESIQEEQKRHGGLNKSSFDSTADPPSTKSAG